MIPLKVLSPQEGQLRAEGEDSFGRRSQILESRSFAFSDLVSYLEKENPRYLHKSNGEDEKNSQGSYDVKRRTQIPYRRMQRMVFT
jgi:hypothetical protein